ncbi:MAG TPA: hypothetical protein VIG99_31565 [Myxococcaceae bacterium]|jgi:hypothetical protein
MSRWKLWLASAAVALAAASCALFAPIEDDRFTCGVFDGDTVRVCDGVGEVCLCQVNRCAVQAWDHCPSSGFRYRFPTVSESLGEADGGISPDCVPAAELHPMISTDIAGPYCPGQDPRQPVSCGVPDHDGGYVTCPSEQYCLCAANPRCAIQDHGCVAETGTPFRYVGTWSCAGTDGADAGALRPRADQSCPGHAPYDLFPDGG